MKLTQAVLKRKKTRLILADGSERGDFIPMDYVFSSMGRIHDGIQLMKTYYPHDEVWSTKHRVSRVTRRKDVNYAWDYEYEDYHPFDLLEDGSDTLKEIEQIKCFGSDLHLTLTLDLSLSDEEIMEIAKALGSFGRVFLRLNHESNGDWFRFNRQYTYKEVSDFFVRCHKIIKRHSHNIYTVFNLTGDLCMGDKIVKDQFLHLSDGELREALQIADYWSVDKYVSLHYNWPFEEKVLEGGGGYFGGTADEWWRLVEETYLKMIWHNGLTAKSLFINEFNSDSDVDRVDGQAKTISDIYGRLAEGEYEWLAGIVLYQFRDYGGLGLEKGTRKEYTELQSLEAYRQAIKSFRYDIVSGADEWKQTDYSFSWLDSDSIRGLSVDELREKGAFTNAFDFPLFVVYGEEQVWKRLEPGQEFRWDGMGEFILLVPPFKGEGGKFNYTITVKDIKNKIKGMIR